jgi:hypothetical protein
VRWPPAWEIVVVVSSVMGYSPVSNDVCTKTKESPLLRSVNQETTSGSRLRRLGMYCSDL